MTATPASAAPRGRLSCSLALSTFCLGVALGAVGPAAVQGALADAAADEAACETETDPARGIAACSRVIEALGRPGPDDAWAFVNRGLSYSDAGDFQRAIEDYTKAIDLDPASRRAFYNRSLAYFDLAEFGRALADLDRAEKLDPDNADTYQARGMVLVEVNRDAEALVQFDRAIALEKDEKFFHNGRAVALTELGRCDEALKSAKMALGLDRHYGNAIVSRGVALACLGHRDAAMQEFGVAIALDKDSGVLLNAIAWKLSKSDLPGFRGDPFPLQMAALAVERSDTHAFRDTLAAALANAGKFDEAVAEERRALQMARDAGETGYEAQYLRRLAIYEKGEMLTE